MSRCISEYLRENSVPASDIKLLHTLRPLLATASTGHLNYDWTEGWVRRMKRIDNLSPSTIRHRHGALVRCFDWMLRKHPGVMAQNPLRLLKRGFATYTDDDRKQLIAAGKTPKMDVKRDRRLDAEEETRILQHMAPMPDETDFFVLALESAMRMRECYTLSIQQISLTKRTIHLDRTKNGDSRQVPRIGAARRLHETCMRRRSRRATGGCSRSGMANLDEHVLDTTMSQVSRLFRNVFAAEEIVNLHFHDLRHEATCRLYERTTLSDVLITPGIGICACCCVMPACAAAI